MARPVLGDLDRRIVAALQRDGRASWTAIADAVDSSAATVARRAERLIDSGTVRVAVVPDIHHAGPVDLFVLRLSCRPGDHAQVIEQLVRRTDIRFLTLLTGSTDIVAELVGRQDPPLHARLIAEINALPGVAASRTDLVLHVYKVAHDWSRQLLTGADHQYRANEPPECSPTHFDDTDQAILALMQQDGRIGFRAVADRIAVNERTVRRRFESLHAAGCLMVLTLVPAWALGFESEMMFSISVEPARLDAVARALSTYRGVRYVAATLDGSSLLCEVILPTTREVFTFVTTTLATLDGVTGWSAGMELLTCKRGFIETPWWRRDLSPRSAADELIWTDATASSQVSVPR